MKYYIIAGEASGDLHGANLMRAIQAGDPEAEFRCWGGDRMADRGGDLVKHYRELAFMGFWEVVTHLRTILRNIAFCKQDIDDYQPDALILIDYPGFNLRIAEYAQRQGHRVFYYISPQVWAWKASRVHGIKRSVEKMYVILPFEQDFYRQYDLEVDFVGHPLLDAIGSLEQEALSPEQFSEEHGLDDRPVIALLPGSRQQEIKAMLPVMLAVRKHYPQYQFVVAGAPSQSAEFYQAIMGDAEEKLVLDQTYPLLQVAHAALVTSGTATLEAALFGVPEVVCYKGGQLSYQIARRLVKIDFISLVNLVMEREVVTELVQQDFTPDNVRRELDRILDPDVRQTLLADYAELKARLGGSGASEKTANLMLKTLRKGQ